MRARWIVSVALLGAALAASLAARADDRPLVVHAG